MPKTQRDPKTPEETLRAIDEQLAGARLRAEELAASIAKMEVRRKRILHANPSLVISVD